MGESVDPETLTISAHRHADSHVMRLADALTMHLGPDDVLLTLDVDFADRLSPARWRIPWWTWNNAFNATRRGQAHIHRGQELEPAQKKDVDGGKDQAGWEDNPYRMKKRSADQNPNM